MSLKTTLGGIALVAGTAIGAAVLALPVATAELGAIQTIFIYFLCWFFMSLSALYLLEVNLALGPGCNLISMAEKLLGKYGKFSTWLVFLILLYALLAAYLTGTGDWITKGFSALQISLPHPLGAFIAALGTWVILSIGISRLEKINRLLIIGLIVAFTLLLVFIYPHISIHQLNHLGKLDITPIPIMITAFGSGIVIPSLTHYLKGNVKQLTIVILIGSLIPLIVYTLWEIAIVGTLPLVDLIVLKQNQQPVVELPQALESVLNNDWITQTCEYFTILALVTSLLGVSLALRDFIEDGLRDLPSFNKKAILGLLSFVPPLLFVKFYPKGFIYALNFAGIFVALLLGIFPCVMAWRKRYVVGLSHSTWRVPGKKILLLLTILFFMSVITIEVYNQFSA